MYMTLDVVKKFYITKITLSVFMCQISKKKKYHQTSDSTYFIPMEVILLSHFYQIIQII